MSNFQNKLFEEPSYSEEGFVSYTYRGNAYKLWYGKVGSSNKPPLLILHGGPGGNHGNLVPLQGLADERTVIFYDQLGCGLSDHPDNRSLWTIQRYTDEVEAVRQALGLDSYHLLGHSWGTTLATAFAHKYPQGILSLSLASPILDFPEYIRETSTRMKANLPGNAARIIDEFELNGVGDEEEYRAAVMKHLKRHVCRLFPEPPGPLTRFNHLKHPQVHDTMVGPGCNSELNVLGNLKDVNVTGFLPGLAMPLFLNCGRYDLCSPELVSEYRKMAPGSQFHVFENSAHMTMLEEPEVFLEKHREFLREHD